MKLTTRVLALLTAVMLMLMLSAGCTSDNGSTDSGEPGGTGNGDSSATTDSAGSGTSYFPLPETTTLSFYNGIEQIIYTYYEGWNDLPFWQELEARTNVHIEHYHAPQDQGETYRAILINSGDYPDLLQNMNTYSGGLSKAIEEEIIYPLNDYLDEYLPNYKAVIESDVNYQLGALLDDGTYAQVCYMNTLDQSPNMGFVMRGDWLEELGYNYAEVETYDEWYEILTKFKVEYNCKAPLYLSPFGGVLASLLSAGYDLSTDCFSNSFLPFTVRDGEIVFSITDDTYIDYLNMLRVWYTEGLIDPNYTSNTMLLTDGGRIANGEVGTWVTYASFMHNYDSVVEDPGFHLVPVQSPALYSGQETHIQPASNLVTFDGVSVSTCAEDIELACRWLDYLYSPEGHIFANYGTEGVSFEIIDGEYVVTSLITDDEQGLGWQKYTLPSKYGFVEEFTRRFSTYDEYQLASVEVWGRGDDAYVMPNGVKLNAEESTEFAQLWGDISTLTNEFINQYITGVIDESGYEDYCNTLSSMSVDRCTQLYQQALDRYLARADVVA